MPWRSALSRGTDIKGLIVLSDGAGRQIISVSGRTGETVSMLPVCAQNIFLLVVYR
jgi:hypothetical protein